MKFIVASLPYYIDECPFESQCYSKNCPRFWGKSFVTSDDNPHECEWLKELEGISYDTVQR